MPELWFDEDADARLTALEADTARAELLARVNDVLDTLQADPGDERVRRHRFLEVGLWCVVVADDDEQWVILWEPHPNREGDSIVQYLGPSSFP